MPADNVIPLRPTPNKAPATRKRRPRRSFGSIRKLPSGNWQASYIGGDGKRHTAPVTFITKGDADAWLALRRAELLSHSWKPPAPPQPKRDTFTAYADQWLENRRIGVDDDDLTARTKSEYRKLIARLAEYWGDLPVHTIDKDAVDEWWESLDPTKRTQRAHLYTLLKTILGTAVEEGILGVNPCQRKGAGRAKRRRKVKPATPAEVLTIAEHMPPRYRAAVLVAAWCALRWGELTELRRSDVDLDLDADPPTGTISITRAVTWPEGRPVVGAPKSEAGVRKVAVPPHIAADLAAHIERHAEPGGGGLLFPAARGGHLNHGTIYKRFTAARAVAGRPDLRWHDLRHTGATMAAQAGATLAELMARLGHSTLDAALEYQHAAADRDQEIARRLSSMAEEENRE